MTEDYNRDDLEVWAAMHLVYLDLDGGTSIIRLSTQEARDLGEELIRLANVGEGNS